LRYRADIDGLRAVAVALVVGFHVFPEWVTGGYIGVDVFFVISGFLISSIIFKSLDNDEFSYLDFYIRRIRRIFPALILVLVACLVFGWFELTPPDFRSLGKHVVAGAAFLSNIVIMFEAGYFDTAAQLKPLLHLWSLGVEEQFYIFWPLVAAAVWGRTKKVGLWIFALVALSFLLSLILTPIKPVAAFYLPVTRFWELGIGCAVAYATRHPTALFGGTSVPLHRLVSGRLAGEVYVCTGLTLIAVGALFFDPTTPFPGWRALLPTIGTAMIIAANLQDCKIKKAISNRAMVGLGLISYPLYLWHWPILVAARFLEIDTARLSVRLYIVLASVFAAWATYRFVEIPIRWSKVPRMIPVTGLCSSLAITGFAGLIIGIQNGVPDRYPEKVRALAAFSYDLPKESRVRRCLLDEDQSFQSFQKECDDKAPNLALQPSILIWGDSHAAALYAGIKKIRDAGEPFRIIQLTASACPPVLGMSVEQRPHCKAINDYVFAQIEALRPSVVVMGAFWSHYNGSPERPLIDVARLRRTIQHVRQLGPQVILVGNVPVWNVLPAKMVVDSWRKSKWLNKSFEHLDVRSMQMNDALRKLVTSLDVTFVSPFEDFCSSEGCSVFADEEGKTLVTADLASHLTPAASFRLMQRPIKDALGATQPNSVKH
jgi:peptidoglycan/LPS O-acetylase OafA/YrhL